MTRAHDGASGIEQQAAEWVARIDLRGTPEEWAALDAWLSQSPRHRAAFLRLSVAWRRFDSLKQLAQLNGEADANLLDPARKRVIPPLSNTGSVARARVIAFESRMPEVRSPEKKVEGDPNWAAARGYRRGTADPKSSSDASAAKGSGWRDRVSTMSTTRRAASIAILATGLAGLGAFGTWQYMNGGSIQTYSTQVGEFHRVTLADGSTVALNTDTQVRVRYTSSRRSVELVRGEALFEVAKDTSRPFDVAAASTTVRAVGTAFSVRLREENPRDPQVDVVVSEGRVAINPPSRQTYAAGSVATVRNRGVVSATMLPFDEIAGRHAWTGGRLQFPNEKLSDVVAEMNRYNRRKLVIVNPRIADLRIGGTFQATDPVSFARGLKPLGIEARFDGREEGVIRLDRAR